MTHDGFNFKDRRTWKRDYEALFQSFQQAITQASELIFPDYSLPWILRTDAGDYGVGAALFQVESQATGEDVHHPISFTSKKFSPAAINWDVYKKEAFGLHHAVNSHSYY